MPNISVLASACENYVISQLLPKAVKTRDFSFQG